MQSSLSPSISTADAQPRALAWHKYVAVLVMSLSGFAGLGYQIVWTRQFSVWLGHEIASTLAVVAAFFGGLALGAWLLGGSIARSSSPARWYAACEAVICAWALVLLWLMEPAGAGLMALTGEAPSPFWHWSVAFLGPFILLLPATAAMGATLPALERVAGRLREEGYAVGALYGANTLGACAGVLACAFILVPLAGLMQTTVLCALLNALCAAGAFGLSMLRSGKGANAVPPYNTRGDAKRLGTLLFASGLLGIAFEVVVVRVLAQVTEGTTYTYALLLAVYLLATALGAAIYQAWLARVRAAEQLLDALVWIVACACLLGTLSLWWSPQLEEAIAGNDFGALLGAEAALAAAAFGVPALAMGALFSHLCVLWRESGRSLGNAMALNTAGGALAPLLFGVLLVPMLGPKFTLLAICASYLLLLRPAQWRKPQALVPLAAIAAAAVITQTLAFVDVPDGGKLLSYKDGVMATVSVVADADGVNTLRINNRVQEGSSATALSDARQAQIPLLLHPSPKRALFLGLGTGVTAAAAAEDPAVKVDAVELVPEVMQAAPLFSAALALPPNAPAPQLHAADARRYARASRKQYDVVVADLYHPGRDGAGTLYTVEHFGAIRTRLAPGGLFCQWLPLHQLDLGTLRSIVRSFVAVYPDAWAVLATNSLDTPVLGLIARPDAKRFEPGAVRTRLNTFPLKQRQAQLRLDDEFALLGNFIGGPAELARFSRAAPVNSDDHPVVAYRAAFIAYAQQGPPRERLLRLLQELRMRPDAVFGTPADAAQVQWQQRMAAYWEARDRFIVLGANVQRSPDPTLMLTQIREPLLDILRSSPEFAPAYDPLLSMARNLAATAPGQARALLEDLQRLNPRRDEARLALAQLPGADTAARP